MKKTIILIAILFATTVNAQSDIKKAVEKAAKTTDSIFAKQIKELVSFSLDTVIVSNKAKVVEIAGKKFYTESFAKQVPVFLSADAWSAVLEIINTRDYGKLPANVIAQLIQGIAQQLPQKQ